MSRSSRIEASTHPTIERAIKSWLRIVAIGLILGFFWATAGASEEIHVNAFTTGEQQSPTVAVTTNGELVVVWQELEGNYYDPHNIRAQRLSSQGQPISGELAISTYSTGLRGAPDVAASPDGGFIVVWRSVGSLGDDDQDSSVQLRRFDSAGNGLTPGEMQVNTYTSGNQLNPAVAVNADGSFVVVWHFEYIADHINFQRYDSTGNPVGVEDRASVFLGDAGHPDVVTTPDAGFVVVWEAIGSYQNDNSGLSVQMTRFEADGKLLGAQAQVNTYTTGTQERPALAAGEDGDLIVVWRSSDAEGEGGDFEIESRRFSPDGTAQGTELTVNSYATGYQFAPAVTRLPNGDFIVAWGSEGSPGNDDDGGSVQLRRLTSDGTPQAVQFQVNTYTTDWQDYPALAPFPDGRFVVAWQSYRSALDPVSYSVKARILANEIFSDGFESGDTSAWSFSVQ